MAYIKTNVTVAYKITSKAGVDANIFVQDCCLILQSKRTQKIRLEIILHKIGAQKYT